MSLKIERFIYTSKNYTTGLTDVTAVIRRNGAVVLNSLVSPIALVEVGNGRYELVLSPAQLTTAGGSGFYDVYIDSGSKSAPAVAAKWILANDADDLEVHLGQIETKIDIIDSVVDSVKVDTASIKTTVEDTNTKVSSPTIGLANLKSLIDAIQSTVSNISNVTRFQAPIPKQIIKPVAGSKTYKIPVRVFDTAGNPEDPDSDEISLSIEDEAGNSRNSYISGFVSAPHLITKLAPGIYEAELSIPSSAAKEQLIFKFSYEENTIELSPVAVSEVVDEAQSSGVALEATSQDILTDTADMQPRVLDIQSKVNDATYGLAAIKALVDTIDTNTSGVASTLANATYGLAALRAQLDLKASQSSVDAITTNLDNNVKGTGFSNATDSLKAVSDRIFRGGQAV